MSQKSSIHFKPSTSFQVFHNSVIRPKYAIGGELISNRNGYEALELKKQIIENAKEAYKTSCKARNKKFQATSYEQSAVCNIKPDTTMQDLERLAEYFEKKYGFQCYQIAIHRDEGHINDEGEKVINHHAHLEFITLDKNTGKSMYRDNLRTKKGLSQIQTEVAEILGMERGVDKRISKRERIEPRKYAQMKEQEKKAQKELKAEHKQELEAKDQEIQEIIQIQNQKNELIQDKDQKIQELIQIQNQEIQELEAELKKEKLSSDEVKAYIEQFRKDCIGKGLPKEFFRKISNLKQQAEATIKELLDDTLETLLQSYLREKEKNIKLENEALKAENNEIKAQEYTLTQEQIQEIINQALAQKKAEIEQKNKEIQDLKTENSKIKEQNYRYFAENDKLNSRCQFLQNEVDKLQKKIRNSDDYTDEAEDQEEYQDQDQTHNEDDLGIDKIIRRKNKA